MAKELQLSLETATDPFPVITSFNRYIVTAASPYLVATCGLVSDDGELLSSFSFSVAPEMSEGNTRSIVQYLTRFKRQPQKPELIHRGIRLPKGGMTIVNAANLNAGTDGGLSEIRLENYSPSSLRNLAASGKLDEDSVVVKCQPNALLRSSFECHFHLLADLFMNS